MNGVTPPMRASIVKSISGHPPRGHQVVVLVVALLGAWLLGLALATPVAAQAEVTPNTPCFSSRNLTNLSVGNVRGITNQPVISGNGNRVAFWSVNQIGGGNADGNIEIFVRETANNNVVQLTESVGSILGGFNLEPSINTAGTHIAFYSDRDLIEGQNADGNFEIFLARRANNGRWSIRQITHTEGSANLFPSINAAGDRIAFVSDDAELHNAGQGRTNAERNFEIFLATIPSSGAVQFQQLTNTGAGVTNDQPVINAAGDRIAFVAATGQTAQIFVWDQGQNAPTQLTQTDINEQPSISADGTSIVYIATTSADRSRVVLHTLSADGRESRAEAIVPSASNTKYRGPSISGNGKRVVYVAEQGTGATIQVDVMLYDTNTGLRVPISEIGGGTGEQPAISSDGTRVTFVGVQAIGGATDNAGADIYLNECPQSDLVLTFEEPPATTVLAGVDVEYTLRVTNKGPSAASNVFFHSNIGALPALPANVTRKLPPGCTVQDNDFYCPLGNLAVDASRVFTFGYDIPPNAGLTNIVNEIDVAADAVDPNPADNATGRFTTRVFEEAALSLQVTASPATILAGSPDQLTYTLRVTNGGPSQARSARITDTLPSGSSFVSVQLVQGGGQGASCAPPVGRVLSCALGNLTTGTVTEVRIRVTANADAPATFTNVATVRSLTQESNLANNTVTTRTPIERSSDMAITMFANADTVIAGTEITYTLAFTNHGYADTVNAAVVDTLPLNVTYVRSSGLPTGASCTAGGSGGRTVTCNFPGNLLVNASRTFSIVARVNSDAPPEPISNSATVSSGRGDPNPANNVTPAVQTQVILLGDLEVTKSASTLTPDVEDEFTYTVAVRNAGPSQAYNVVVTDVLPSELIFISATPSVGTYDPGSGIWNVGTLPVSAQASTLLIRMRAPIATGGASITNSATASGSQPEPEEGLPNSDSVEIVPQLADLSIDVSSVPPAGTELVAGQRLTYTLTVYNDGPTLARAVRITHTLPADIFLVSATTPTGGPCTGSSPLLCDVGDMEYEEEVTYTVVVTKAIKGELSSTITVGSPTPDDAPGNNTENHTITVIPDLPAYLDYTVEPPGTIGAGAIFDPAVRVEIYDQFGNTIVAGDEGSGDTIALVPFTGVSCTEPEAGEGAISGNEVTAVDGAATFTSLSYTRAETIYLLATDIDRDDVTACFGPIVVEPGATSQLAILPPSQVVTAGHPSEIMTVQRQDIFGNATIGDQLDVTLTTTSEHGGFRDETDTFTITTVSILTGQSIANFLYLDTDATTNGGVHTLTASASGLTDGIRDVTIVAGPASTLLVVLSAPTSVTAGEQSADITVERRDTYGNANSTDDTLPIMLDSNSPDETSFTFYDESGEDEIDETAIEFGSSTTTFRYYDTLAGERELTFDALMSGIASAYMTITVDPAITHRLVMTITEPTVTAGEPSAPIQVARVDAYGNLNFNDPVTVVQLSSTSTGMFTYTPSSLLQIQPGNASIEFTYADTLAGEHELTAAADNIDIESAMGDITVEAADAYRLRFVTPPRTLRAGIPSDEITVERQDRFGNARVGPELIVSLDSSSSRAHAFLEEEDDEELPNGNELTIPNNSARATFRYRDIEVGSPVLTATGGGLNEGTQQQTVRPGSLDRLQWSAISTQTNDVPFTEGTITAYDAYDNIITDYNESEDSQDVTITATNRPDATVVLGDAENAVLAPADFDNGVAYLYLDNQELIYTGMAGSVNFEAAAGDVSGDQDIEIIAGALASLLLEGPDDDATAGEAFNVTLTGRDVSDNLIVDVTHNNARFSGADPAPNGEMPTANGIDFGLDTSVTFDGGEATVSLMLPNAQDDAAIVATINGIPSNALAVEVEPEPALADLFWSEEIDPQAIGVPFTEGTITARDRFENVITSFADLGISVVITVPAQPSARIVLESYDDGDELPPEAFDDGIAYLEDAGLIYTGLSGAITFRAERADIPAVGGNREIQITAGTIASLSMDGPASVTAGEDFNVILTGHDASGNLVNGGEYNVTFTDADESPDGDDSPTANGNPFDEEFTITFDTLGIAIVELNLPNAELTTVTATIEATPTDVSASHDVDVIPDEATRLELAMDTTTPITAGTSRTLTITAYDQFGNVATGYDDEQTLTFSGPMSSTRPVTPPTVVNNASAAIPIGAPTALDFDQGVVQADFTPTRAGEEVMLSVGDGTISSSPDELWFSVIPAAANKLSIYPATATIVAGTTLNLSMRYEDVYGNLRADDGGDNKQLRFASDIDTQALDGTNATVTPHTGTAVNISAVNNTVPINLPGGVSTVSGSSNGVLTISKVGTFVITVDDRGTGGLDEGKIAGALTITVTPAALAELNWVVTGPQTNNVPFDNGTLTAWDEFQNVITEIDSGEFPIQVLSPSGDVFFDLSGINNELDASDFDDGVAYLDITTGSGMRYEGESGPVSITATSRRGRTGTLNITINPGAVTAMAWAINGAQESGEPMDGSLTVYDVSSNIVTGFAGTVAIAQTSAATGTLSLNQLTGSDWSNGVAQLATAGDEGLSYDGLPGQITLEASYNSGAVTQSVNVQITAPGVTGSVTPAESSYQFFLPSITQPGVADSQRVTPDAEPRLFLPTLRLQE